MIRFSCFCGRRLKARPELAGRRARCPVCRITMSIPRPPEVPEEFSGEFGPPSATGIAAQPPEGPGD
jgi:hypothetical protein